MAFGNLADMVIFNEQFYGGFQDRVQTRLNVFNAESMGTINLSAMFHIGLNKEEAFFTDNITVQHRDPRAASGATVFEDMGSDTTNMIKVFKYIAGEQSEQSFVNQGLDMEDYAFLLGNKRADRILEAWRESAISALSGTFDIAAFNVVDGPEQLVHDVTGSFNSDNNGIMDQSVMVDALRLYGDAARQKLKLVIMHGDVYWQLVKESIGNLATTASADFTIQGGLPATLGLPILVVDSPALVLPAAGNQGQTGYRTIILQEGAAKLVESEIPRTYMDQDLDKVNTTIQMKTELAYSVGIRGFAFDLAQVNPEDTALVTAANWTKKYASKRDLAGVAIHSLRVANSA